MPSSNDVLTKRFDKELFVADLYNGNQLLNWQTFRTKFGLRNNNRFFVDSNHKCYPHNLDTNS